MVKFSHRIADDITVKLIDDEQAEALFDLVDINREYLREWLTWLDANTTLDDTKKFIQKSREQYANNEGFQAAIWYQEQLVGMIGFNYISWANRETSIGYWLGEEFQGNGIITKGCQVLIEYAFKDLGMNRIEIRCATKNQKSRAIPERLGFTMEGVLRQKQWLYDRFEDWAIYSLLRHEWKKPE